VKFVILATAWFEKSTSELQNVLSWVTGIGSNMKTYIQLTFYFFRDKTSRVFAPLTSWSFSTHKNHFIHKFVDVYYISYCKFYFNELH